MGLFGLFGFGTRKTKSYYAKQIAQEERNLAELKRGLVAQKSWGKLGATGVVSYKMQIEQKKGYIASLKAEMKAAPKD